nr:MAG TPA: hypothetical protein [Crassvirales sp.]
MSTNLTVQSNLLLMALYSSASLIDLNGTPTGLPVVS